MGAHMYSWGGDSEKVHMMLCLVICMILRDSFRHPSHRARLWVSQKSYSKPAGTQIVETANVELKVSFHVLLQVSGLSLENMA